MEKRWWETPATIINDYWWAWLLILVLALTAFFTRNMWLPNTEQVDLPSGMVATAVSGVGQLETLLPAETVVAQLQTIMPTAAVPTAAPTADLTALATDTPEAMQTQTLTVEGTAGPAAVAQVGSTAPNFSLTDIDGKRVSLSDFEGQPVFVIFFASWCPHCEAEAAAVKTIADDYRDRGLVVVAVNITFNDNESDVQTFVQTNGWEFPILLDQSGGVMELYGQDGVPGNVFISSTGVISDMVSGAIPQEDLERMALKILQ